MIKTNLFFRENFLCDDRVHYFFHSRNNNLTHRDNNPELVLPALFAFNKLTKEAFNNLS